MRQHELSNIFVLNNLSDIGNWLSIVSFLMTLATFGLLWNIKKKFLFRSNVETYKDLLSDKTSEMSTLLQNYNGNQHDIDELLAIVDVELRAIQKGAKENLLVDVKKARALIKKYMAKHWFRDVNKFKNESTAREIKTSLSYVVAEFEHVKKALLVGN
jgi:hypothetical protein